MPELDGALGHFSHVRIDVADLARAEDFYREVVGFELVVQYSTDTYSVAQMAPGGRLPGIELWEEQGVEVYPEPRLHIALLAEDVDGAFDKAVARGAHPVRPPFSIGDERIALIRDPDGYVIELHCPPPAHWPDQVRRHE
jgi:predicted enzyme related to lactoylglutathione lyase